MKGKLFPKTVIHWWTNVQRDTAVEQEERAVEHWGAARRGEEESHMVRHQRSEHGDAPPKFHFKVVSTHRTALNRQVREAIRIRKRGGAGAILNSRAEFNSSIIKG